MHNNAALGSGITRLNLSAPVSELPFIPVIIALYEPSGAPVLFHWNRPLVALTVAPVTGPAGPSKLFKNHVTVPNESTGRVDETSAPCGILPRFLSKTSIAGGKPGKSRESNT